MIDLRRQFAEIQSACDRLKAQGMQFDEEGSIIGSPQTQRPIIGPTKLHIGPPITEKGLEKMEETFGHTFPASLRNVFLEQSCSFGVSWSIKENRYRHEGFSDIYYGEFILNFTELYHLGKAKEGFLERNRDDQDESVSSWLDLYRNRKPLMELRNGDTLLMGMDDEHQEIVYFMHDALDGSDDWYKKHGTVLGKNFEDFLDRWCPLAFAGPEHWILERFLSPDGIEPAGKQAAEFQDWFFARQ